VYPADASLIVSLLDIHPSINSEADVKDEPFEIFEAGTGHGALTLHLARAIHGLNPVPPPLPTVHTSDRPSTGELATKDPEVLNSNQAALATDESSKDKLDLCNGDVSSYSQDPQPIKKFITCPEHKSIEEVRFKAYLSSRQAVVHSLDISPNVSKHAQSTIRKFRRGLYYHNIDFHVGTIPDYLSSRLATTNGPFLEHTILDLPNPQDHLHIVGQSLKPNGSLIVFCPSITQIADCVKLIGEKKLPFHLESVLELGPGAGVGGREWDVRIVKRRAVLKAEAEARKVEEQSEAVPELDSADNGKSLSTTGEDSGWAMVCRPKVGGLVSGGGFLALWRRMGGSSASRAHRSQPVGAVDIERADVDEPEHQPVGEPESEK
jgi:tRNA (adenine57-N1/adenine58-N1)-methyltransferase catalytic subunit